MWCKMSGERGLMRAPKGFAGSSCQMFSQNACAHVSKFVGVARAHEGVKMFRTIKLSKVFAERVCAHVSKVFADSRCHKSQNAACS